MTDKFALSMTNPITIKLQAYVAHAGIASRRKAEMLITESQITVNGQIAHLGQRITPGQDIIEFQGKKIEIMAQHHYYLVNKQVGLLSTTSDELQRKTVMSLLPSIAQTYRLYPVGRLDQDSQGLMLLTDDGDLAYHLTHPKFEVPKTYQVVLDRPPTHLALEHLKKGVELSDGYTQPLELSKTDDPQNFTITITEGRNHQVRRMWQRVGYEVTQLTRIAFGPWHLTDLDNKPFLELSPQEIAQKFPNTISP